MAENVHARASRYGWQTRSSEDEGSIWLTSPVGDEYYCELDADAHDLLNIALMYAWLRYEQCRQIVAIANDPGHEAHEAVTRWLIDPEATFDPWKRLPHPGPGWAELPDTLPEGFEAMCVDGYQGSDLRLAMERFKAIEGARQLDKALSSVSVARGRARL
ncbi:hypothetical protein [Luteibacter sahnii]|uniref:hypothetical protein n=1 Tax=Luteibacter sahnii TaxID=3021977 RepID=UPI002A69F809|nr:hypothetical protein [Luteibacter sp. PPL193]MDY1549581.1 hypothetical protein [Luteibacter sp. PPL193]